MAVAATRSLEHMHVRAPAPAKSKAHTGSLNVQRDNAVRTGTNQHAHTRESYTGDISAGTPVAKAAGQRGSAHRRRSLERAEAAGPTPPPSAAIPMAHTVVDSSHARAIAG